ncbi:MAG: carbohydrate binding family 9 domain-containing protein [Gemmatimonadetes bacterium]|nr:carbohydrate binding family 9 domain-containing protein [Gemmatimonadota bacterium]
MPLCLAIFCLLILAVPAAGERSSMTANAVRIEPHAIELDGRLDDPVWTEAPFVAGFTQKDPAEGDPSAERTEISFLYDNEFLYVGARLYKREPNDIRATVSRRDRSGNSERIIVTLDTYNNRRTSYSFCVTATGVRVDYYHPSDSEGNREYSYDPVWEASTEQGEHGWTAEMKIPFSQLRFQDVEEQVWGLNMNRWTPSINEDSYWVYIPKEETGWSSRFGTLHGLRGIRPSRRIELQPYFASDATFTNDFDEDDPFEDGQDFEGRAGADLKVGLGPNLTLEAAFNPDFGQVEADPAEVNLSAFETFFDEKRPFFIEGSRLLQGNGSNFFYSRRIGARPRGDADGDFVSRPNNATILGSAKMTGRLASGLSVGALTAVTSREYAEVYTESTDTFSKIKVAPLTNYNVGRLEQEFGEDQSTVGVTMTAMARDFGGTEELRELLNEQAFAGGGDWRIRFNGGQYLLGGNVGFSHISGDSTAILRAQRSSRRYFQRPDADYVEVDSSRTTMSGYASSLWFERNSGDHWLWGLGGGSESPGFEINDVGRLSQGDDIDTWANVRYRETKPGSIFRNYSIAMFGNAAWNHGWQRQRVSGSFELNGGWRNFWSSWAGVWYAPRYKADNWTRGGPLMETLDVYNIWFGTQNNWASDTFWNMNTNYTRDELGTWNYNISGQVSVKPGTRWEISASPRYSRSSDGRQYIATEPRAAGSLRPGDTFGNRYIFSWINRTTLATTFRLNYSLTPDLSLEVYAEPFVASGHFYDYGELEAPGARTLITYGEEGGTELEILEDGTRVVTDGAEEFELENDDFNFLSFRSNFVVRWEWRRGSTFFLVWQQNRSDFFEEGSRVGGQDLADTFSAEGENFLAAKVTYWIPVP